ncbi:glycoside hydrolase 100 family protein [Altericista sp. CCNU0014]|uniref:glycoside hydrolase 100 family protein n=1 Tax=Altericista sp. CCNU0014 TaxID=3082949 RepID=UPI00384D7953
MVTLSWSGLKEIAWRELNQAKYLVYHQGQPLGTKAADVPSDSSSVNYDQCFIRDFFPVALIYLIRNQEIAGHDGETVSSRQVVGNFLATILHLQITPERSKYMERSPGMMPASFKVEGDILKPDYGERAIAQVTPVDSCLWWLILLQAYYLACTQDQTEMHPDLFDGKEPQPKLRRGIRLILSLYLSNRFDAEPMIMVPDGACMIDRRMGLNGYPLEIQTLFFAGLQVARDFLKSDEPYQIRIRHRLRRLQRQICEDYWLDLRRLRMLYQAQSEQYDPPPGIDAEDYFFNKYNLYPESIPYEHLIQWLPEKAGYLVGNLGPSHLDCRFFAIGNLMGVIGNLLPKAQARSILDLIYLRHADLLGEMPMKVCYPAIQGLEWQLVTGCDPKNKPWSYHNGGSWPMLVWMLAAATLKVKHPSLTEQLREDIVKAGHRLIHDRWPEYYDGGNGRLIGRMARRYQTWSIAGILLAQEFLDCPQTLDLIHFGDPYP